MLSAALCGLAASPVLLAADGNIQAQAATNYSIVSNEQVGSFVQAINVPNAVVTIAGNVTLNLTGLQELPIASGVKIIGDRTKYPKGPLLHITPPATGTKLTLFALQLSDNVLISGIRLNGGAGPEYRDTTGISINSSQNVEIRDSEIYGWGIAGIELNDWSDRLSLSNPSAIRIHNNWIHDNQNGGGYGVTIGRGAFAKIERNVFYNNRHSIAADGTDGVGYLAYRNLVLPNAGVNADEQQFDAHGQWGDDADRGPAGEYYEIRQNTFQHIMGNSFKLRGYPRLGADVVDNVFASRENGLPPVLPRPLVQTDGDNLHQWNNRFGYNTGSFGSCDFDRDGRTDRFMATGVTWWYESSLQNRWIYLYAHQTQMSGLTLRDVNGDRRCDVVAGGLTYYTPASNVGSQMSRVPNLIGLNRAGASSALTAAALALGATKYQEDPTCNDVGVVMGQTQTAGTLVSPGITVGITVGTKPTDISCY